MNPILIVEDDPHTQLIIQRKLEQSGYTVQSVANSYDALDLLDSVTPRLIIVDVILPGMNGIELCRTIRNNLVDQTPPLLIISSMGDESDVTEADSVGAADYLIKPFSPAELLRRVQAILTNQ